MNKNKFLIGSMLTISSFVLVSQSAIFAEDESNIKASIENIHNKVASSESTTVRSELKDVLVSEGHQTETFDEKNQDDLNKISDKNDIKNENKDSIINNEDREKLLDSDLKKPKNVSKDKETEFEGNRSSEILAPTTSRESENSLESYLETDTNLSKENLKSTYMNDQNAQILGSTITDSQNLVYKILSYKDGVGTVQLGDGEKSLIWNDDTLRISNVIQNEKGTFTVTEIASNAFYSVIEESSGQRMGPNVSKVIVPNSILKIQDRAFFSAETIRNVEFLPKSNLKHIGKEAFYFSNLKNIIIPDSVETIGDKAFSFNENLTDLEIGDASNLKTIGKGAFSSNKKLKRLYIPKGVTSIGEEAFITTPDLEEIRVSSSNNNFKDIDGILFNKDEKNLIKYPSRKVERNYEIPEKVVFIADYAFDNNDNLKELIFGKNVKKIGDFTFKNADKLEKINLNEGLEEIGRLAFYYMPSLESVELPKSLNSLGRNPFYGLDSLTTIIFGEGVKEFSNSTIAGPLGSLKKIIIKAKNATFAEDSFNLPDNIKGTVKIEVASDNIKNKMVELGFKEENILINLDDDTPDDGTPDEETPDGGTPDEETPDGGTPDEETPDGGTPD
ncbi:leucine-rich repeat domain-containing protein, partial [Facklamia sp. P13064]|uniref:leucine-rich repeat domain-containing protein n=2 Tax=Facklamia TaxID=66831 RepID=UPI003D16BEDC